MFQQGHKLKKSIKNLVKLATQHVLRNKVSFDVFSTDIITRTLLLGDG